MYVGSVASDGTLKLDGSDTNVNDYVNINANGEALYLFQLEDPLAPGGKLAYYAGFRLKGLELESNQRFDVMNLTVKPQFAAWIPYSNLPGLWWARAVGISGNAATPLSVFVGYTFSEALQTRASVIDPRFQKSDRLETELAYALPITSNIRAGVRARLFWLFDIGTFESYEEVFVRRYLDANKTTAVEFKYVHGAVPPTFQTGDTAGAGFSVEF